MSQTLSQAVGIRLAKETSYSARIILGDEAVRVGLANRAEKNKEDLDNLVDKISSQISSNSKEAVTAFKDLYNLAQSGLGLDEALKAELDREYPEIKDTTTIKAIGIMNVDSNANFASKIVKTVAPKMAGIARKNENLAASFFAMPRVNAVVMVIPDLEIPGIIANA